MALISFDTKILELKHKCGIPKEAYAWTLEVSYTTGKAVVKYTIPESSWRHNKVLGCASSLDIQALATYFEIPDNATSWQLKIQPEEVVRLTTTTTPYFTEEIPDIFKDSK